MFAAQNAEERIVELHQRPQVTAPGGRREKAEDGREEGRSVGAGGAPQRAANYITPMNYLNIAHASILEFAVKPHTRNKEFMINGRIDYASERGRGGGEGLRREVLKKNGEGNVWSDVA